MKASPVFTVGAFRTALLASPEAVAGEFSQHRAIACAGPVFASKIWCFSSGERSFDASMYFFVSS